MPSLEITNEQVVELVRNLPPEQKRAALLALAEDAASRREERMGYAGLQLRRLCTERGLNWDAMTEAERENFVDDLVHEDRACRP